MKEGTHFGCPRLQTMLCGDSLPEQLLHSVRLKYLADSFLKPVYQVPESSSLCPCMTQLSHDYLVLLAVTTHAGVVTNVSALVLELFNFPVQGFHVFADYLYDGIVFGHG